jgi:hypothetical protein
VAVAAGVELSEARECTQWTAGQERALRASLALWVGLAGALFLAAPPPPAPPATTAEDEAVFQRTVDQTVEKVRRWELERGDFTIPWDEAEGHLALLVADVGDELHLFEQLLALRWPLSFGVRPGAVYAPGVQLRSRADRRRYREILLHLPAGQDLERALALVPGADGVDLTANDAPVAAPGLTTLGPALDGDLVLAGDRAAVLAQLAGAAERARARPVVVIARPSPALVEVLRDGLPRLYDAGIGVYPVKEILARRGPAGGSGGPASAQ